MYEAQSEFPEGLGGGGLWKIPFHGGGTVWIFSGTTHWSIIMVKPSSPPPPSKKIITIIKQKLIIRRT